MALVVSGNAVRGELVKFPNLVLQGMDYTLYFPQIDPTHIGLLAYILTYRSRLLAPGLTVDSIHETIGCFSRGTNFRPVATNRLLSIYFPEKFFTSEVVRQFELHSGG